VNVSSGTGSPGLSRTNSTEVVQNDRHARKLNSEEAMDRSRWRKQIKDS